MVPNYAPLVKDKAKSVQLWHCIVCRSPTVVAVKWKENKNRLNGSREKNTECVTDMNIQLMISSMKDDHNHTHVNGSL